MGHRFDYLYGNIIVSYSASNHALFIDSGRFSTHLLVPVKKNWHLVPVKKRGPRNRLIEKQRTAWNFVYEEQNRHYSDTHHYRVYDGGARRSFRTH